MALTTDGSVEPQPNPRATAAAAAVYDNDATRMHREAGTAAVAAAHTSTPTAESSYADGAFELGQPTQTPGKAAQGNVADVSVKPSGSYPNT